MEMLNKRYILHEVLGQGSMGKAFRATDRLTRSVVALKRVSIPVEALEFASTTLISGDSIAHLKNRHLALINEFQTLASLRHPNIITVMDYGFDEAGNPFFTMDYLHRSQSILQASLGKSHHEKMDLLVQVLQALAYLHRHGVLHRDLKPGNILVVDSGVRVLDFGLAVKQSRAEGRIGTLAYMAPEAISNGQIGPATDLYALGVIAYQLFSGELPFETKNLRDVLFQPPDMQPLIENPILAQIVERLLQKDPVDRYPDAAAAVRALNQALGRSSKAESPQIRESFLQAARFVGRETEMKQFSLALDDAFQGQGSAWLVGGESGVGKSRLLDEVRIRALVKGAMVLCGQGVEEGGRLYQLWQEPLKHLALSVDLNDLQAGTLKTIIPDLEFILDRPISDLPELETQNAQQRLLLTILEIFKHAAKPETPIVLLLEDLQWTIESLEPLKMMTRVIAEMPLVVIGSYRSEQRPELLEILPDMQVMPLSRLSPKDTVELIGAILGAGPTPKNLIDLLQKETEGNTFFLVESIRTLAQDVGRLDAIAQSKLPEKLFVEGVDRLIRRRLEYLSPLDLPLLQLAAVAGRALDLDMLRFMALDVELDGWLERNADLAILEVQENQWRFAHDKLRNMLQESILDAELPRLHGQIAQVLERLYLDDPERAAALARHWGAAGDTLKERLYACRAGEYASARFAHQEALHFFNRALDLTTAEDLHGRSELLMARARIYHLLGKRDSQTQDLTALEEIVRQREMPSEQAEVALLKAQMYDVVSDFSSAFDAIQDAISLAKATKDSARLANAYLLWGRIHWRKQEYPTAKKHLMQALFWARKAQDAKICGSCLRILGAIASEMGDYHTARNHYQQSLSLYQEINNLQGQAMTLNNLGVADWYQGQYEQSKAYYQQSLSIARQIGNRQGESSTLNNLGTIASDLGDFEQAVVYYQESLRIRRAIGNQYGVSHTLINLGNVYARQGSLEMALEYVQQGLQIKEQIGDREGKSYALIVMGICAQFEQDYTQARIYFEESLVICRQIGNRWGESGALFYLGDVMILLEDLTAAQDAMRTAVELQKSIGHQPLQIECLAGLARSQMALNELMDALKTVDEILMLLDRATHLRVVISPRVLLTCYRVLFAQRDVRAAEMLRSAHRHLQRRAEKISDEQTRQAFLENIPWQQEIVTKYEIRKKHRKRLRF